MSAYPKLDIVMLDNWLRGCTLNLAGENCTFPNGREFFGRMLLGERIKLEQRAAASETARLRALSDNVN